MRFFVWTCRVLLTVVIGAFVATVFYLTHSVSFPEGAKAALNWVTVAGTAVVGLAWPLMRRYWQALLLLVGLGVARALFGTHPGLSNLTTPLLTPFQSDFFWVSIGVVFVVLVVTIIARAILSDRHMRAMRQAASATVITGPVVAAETAAALREPAALAETAPAPVMAPEAPAEATEPEPTQVMEAVAPPADPAAAAPQAAEGKKPKGK
jgi:hypothetical protein